MLGGVEEDRYFFSEEKEEMTDVHFLSVKTVPDLFNP